MALEEPQPHWGQFVSSAWLLQRVRNADKYTHV